MGGVKVLESHKLQKGSLSEWSSLCCVEWLLIGGSIVHIAFGVALVVVTMIAYGLRKIAQAVGVHPSSFRSNSEVASYCITDGHCMLT